ncbi:MAG: hypothetical protein JJU33_09770 [Phycisphaerales bacterium]|nr:hypothetical protein [Phycisphaerales bacterium]
MLRSSVCVCLCAASGVVSAQPVELTPPDVAASIRDTNKNGVGDIIAISPAAFSGLIRQRVQDEDRAIQEFDISQFAGQTVLSATIRGRVSVNNAFDVGVRSFEFGIYTGDGQATLDDFDPGATIVGTGQYQPPIDSFFEFEFVVTAEIQDILDDGGSWAGLWVNPTSEPNFPNILSEAADTAVLTIEVPGCPPDINGDGVVDADDFFEFLSLFAAGDLRADFNNDGVIDADDFFAFLAAFAAGC